MSFRLFNKGTLIGAYVREAQSSESIKDVEYKLNKADKEAKEVEYWLFTL